MRVISLAVASFLCTSLSIAVQSAHNPQVDTNKQQTAAKLVRLRLGSQMQFLVLQLITFSNLEPRIEQEKNLQGGKTCAASPQRITRSFAHWLHDLAEKVNGRHLRTSIQSFGYSTSSGNLYAVISFFSFLAKCCIDDGIRLPVPSPFVSEIGEYNLVYHLFGRHLDTIFSR